MKRKSVLRLLISILLPLSAGFIGSYFTTPAIDSWYAELNKPSFNPPNYLFAPVWTVLYILMGTSLFLIWEKTRERIYFALFAVQLFLNSTWSILFFAMESPGIALLNIVLLIAIVIYMMVLFYKKYKIAAYLLFPYILWIIFAGILNYSIWILN